MKRWPVWGLFVVTACGGAANVTGSRSPGGSARSAQTATPPELALRQGSVLYYDYKNLYTPAGRGGYGVGFHIELAVSTPTYDKSAGIVWSADNWATTLVCNAAYEDQLTPNVELWGGDCLTWTNGPVNAFSLAAFLNVGTTTAWDNNGGRNYTLQFSDRVGWTPSPAQGLTTAGSLEPAHTELNPNDVPALRGTAWVWDYAGSPSVTVVYSTDNWATTLTAPATPDGTGFYTWLVPLSANTQQAQYAVVYDVAGVEFWDNNGGKNYTVQ